MSDRKPGLRLALAGALLAAGLPARAATLTDLLEPLPPTTKPLAFQPYVGFTQAYDTNIYLQPQSGPGTPVIGSWIEVPQAGLNVPMQLTEKSRLDLSYNAADRVYLTDPSINNAVIQAAGAKYWYEGPRGLRLRASDDYLNTVDPADSELIARDRRWENALGAEGAYQPEGGRLSLSVDGTDTRDKYVSDDFVVRQALDRYEEVFGGKVGWQLQPKTVAYVAYHRDIMHFTDNPVPEKDNTGHLVDFGVQGDLAPKVTGKAQVGFVDRLYAAPPGPGLSQETQNLTSMVDLAYVPVERSKADLTFNRQLEESAFDINQFYIASGGTLTLSHTFPWQLFAELSGGAEWDKYPTTTAIGSLLVNRRDDNYQGGASLEYPLREWLKADLSYLYRARFSKDLSAQFNFRDQITSLSLTATF